MNLSRSKILKIGLFCAVGIIILRLFWIQIIDHDNWVAKAAEQQTLQSTIIAKRGEIYMMNGDDVSPVAMNESVWTIIVDPMVANREEVEKVITENAKDKLTASFDDAFANKELRYYVVAKEVERPAAEKISEANVVGVWLQEHTKRIYPEGELASTILGFVNADGKGQYGVEGSLDDELKGKNGLLKTTKDVNNIALSIGSDNVRIPAEDGKNIVLTIDRNLQYNIEKILAEQMQKMGKTNASALVMDPNNGKILAMTNLPNYNPANYGQVKDASAYINGVVEDPYEPASVCKTFTFAAGVDQGVMSASSTYVNEGSTVIDGWTIKNAEQGSYLLGTQNIQTAFNYSLNTGSIQALRWIGGDASQITDKGREILYDYFYNRFGLGKETGIELLESIGTITKPYEGYGLASTYANMTFGQNLQVTMLQTAAGFASVVNGGKYYTPTIIAGELNENGELVKKETQPAVRQTISEETSAAMREMLYGTRHAWRDNGTDPAGYYVGGKTGTAQVIRDGAYVLDETKATYIGYGGTSGKLPSYVIMVRIWKDGATTEGQTHALPVFNALKAYVQDYLKVKPEGA